MSPGGSTASPGRGQADLTDVRGKAEALAAKVTDTKRRRSPASVTLATAQGRVAAGCLSWLFACDSVTKPQPASFNKLESRCCCEGLAQMTLKPLMGDFMPGRCAG